jgi:hypothetical protein
MIYGEEEFDDELKKMIKSCSERQGKEHRHSCYHECVEHAEEMSWHLYGDTPDALLDRVRPREDPEVTKYRKDNYEPTTKSAADKAINIVSKIFNPNLYSIRWKTESASGKTLKEYTLEYYPEHNSVVNYTKDVLLRKMLADPNGVAVVKLKEIPEKTNEELMPVLCLYGSSHIWNFDEDHYLIFIKDEEIKAKNGGRIKWYYFEYYDKNDYLSFRAYVTSTGKLVVEEEDNYPHNFEEIPVWRLQGVPEAKDNGEIVYKSFFNSAAPYWNLAIIHESDVLGAFINHIHPQKYELAEPCSYKMGNQFPCRQGKIKMETGETIDCPKCDGTGWRNMAGPYGVYKYTKEKLSEGDGPVGIDPVGYINVPIDATKMLEERAARMEKKGMWAINMDVEDEVGENQSGVAKVIDRSAQYDTLYNIGSVVFDVHLQNTFYFFNKYMFGVADRSAGKDAETNLPEINKPTQFDIASTAELVANYKVAKDSGLDPNFLQIKQIEIGTRDLTTNPDLKKFTNLLLDLDPLPGMDANTVSLNVSKYFIRQVDAVIHFNIKRFLERAIQEDKTFTEKKREEQIAVLEKYGEEVVKETKPKIDPTMLAYAQEQKKQAAQAAFA